MWSALLSFSREQLELLVLEGVGGRRRSRSGGGPRASLEAASSPPRRRPSATLAAARGIDGPRLELVLLALWVFRPSTAARRRRLPVLALLASGRGGDLDFAERLAGPVQSRDIGQGRSRAGPIGPRSRLTPFLVVHASKAVAAASVRPSVRRLCPPSGRVTSDVRLRGPRNVVLEARLRPASEGGRNGRRARLWLAKPMHFYMGPTLMRTRLRFGQCSWRLAARREQDKRGVGGCRRGRVDELVRVRTR